jgi:hypothetical protein
VRWLTCATKPGFQDSSIMADHDETPGGPIMTVLVRVAISGAALALASLVACSSDDDAGSSGGAGGTSASGQGGAAASSSGGSAALGGSGGFGAIDAGGGSGGSGGFDPDSGCTGVAEQAENKALPADIIIAVDQSTSMTDETLFVQTQLNNFASQVIAKGIDAQIVLIAERPAGYDTNLESYGCQGEEWPTIENPICIPEPLAGPSCGNKAPVFLSLSCHVDSHDAFDKILDLYDVYRTSLRPNASRHVIVITDDSPDLGSGEFDTQVKQTDASFANYFFHAIVPFTDCSYASGEATDYLDLVQQTAGVSGDLCTQDFQPVWDALSKHVTENTKIACEWEIPPAPAGQTLNPGKVNVRFTTASGASDLGRVDSAAECAGHDDAWYYDDNTQPTKVIACPALCDRIETGQALEVEIVFGCDSRPPDPT